jgi:hypothetical protein
LENIKNIKNSPLNTLKKISVNSSVEAEAFSINEGKFINIPQAKLFNKLKIDKISPLLTSIKILLNKNNLVINIISGTFLVVIINLFISNLNIIKSLQIVIFSIFSFAISMFISDKFKFSNSKFIKFLQKFVVFNSILALIGLILYLFEFNIFNKIFSDSDSEDENINNKEKINEEKSFKNKDIIQVTSETNNNNEDYYKFKIKKDVFDNAIEKG